MRFFVTGTPRSATRYTSLLLDKLGLPCTHEAVAKPLATWIDVLRWYEEARHGESSWMAWTVLPSLPRPVPVLHTVRDPWRVIDSLCTRNAILIREGLDSEQARIREVIRAYAPEVWQWPKRIDRAACLVIAWNRLIEERCPHRFAFRVDRLDVLTMRRLLRHLGVERSDAEIETALAAVPTNVNGGYTVTREHDADDPLGAELLRRFATQPNTRVMSVVRVPGDPKRQTPEEIAARLDPRLLEEVNRWAAHWNYATVETPAPIGG